MAHYLHTPTSTIIDLSDEGIAASGIDLTVDWIELSDEDAASIVADRNKPTPKQIAQEEIAKLEASLSPRRFREALLTEDYSFIKNVEEKISVLRAVV